MSTGIENLLAKISKQRFDIDLEEAKKYVLICKEKDLKRLRDQQQILKRIKFITIVDNAK